MDKKLISIVLIVILAGCIGTNSGLELSTAINESKAVEDINISQNNVGELFINVDLEKDVMKNDKNCYSVYNPALKITETKCTNNWDSVKVTNIKLMQNESLYKNVQASNGDDVTINIPNESKNYKLYFESKTGGDTYFQINVNSENVKINSAGYSNSY